MKKVFDVGLHIIDMLGYPISDIPPGQGVEFVKEIKLCVAGTAAASAVGLARLGKPVYAVGVIGEDLLGDILIMKMKAEGVHLDFITRTAELPTSSTILPIRPNGSRPALHVIGATASLSLSHFPLNEVSAGDVVHIGGTFLMPGLDGEDTAKLAKECKARGATVTMDFIPHANVKLKETLEPALPYIDYIFPNLEDAMYYAGTRTLDETLDHFLDRGVGWVVLTLGADGVAVKNSGGMKILLEAFEVDVVDTSGCGDAFCAGFISGLIEDLPLSDCMNRGLAAGSLVATGLGSDAGLKDMEQVNQLIASGKRIQNNTDRK